MTQLLWGRARASFLDQVGLRQRSQSWRWTLSLLVTARLFGCATGAFAVRGRRSRMPSFHGALRAATGDAQDGSRQRLVQIGRDTFQSEFGFELDDWQCQAGGAITEGSNVIVCAPTGAGKTVVGEMALIHALQLQKKGIYTTPLKALSNQKYVELVSRFDSVGLSTGDVSVNKGARVTVMTTEVYRNQAARFGSSTQSDRALEDTVAVVLDEFHYMGLPGRGGVWEESVITSPDFVQIVALSATLSNAGQLAEWIGAVTRRPTLLVQVPDSLRPVPLRYLFATSDGLYPLFRDPDAGPGAPHGLLGWKDQVTEVGGQGFGRTKVKARKLPRGLEINPALKAVAQRRMQKVARSLERAKLEASAGIRKRRRHFDGEDDSFFDRSRDLTPRILTGREEQKEKERLLRRELRRAVPSLSALVQRLKLKDLLPAIIFIFSRAGCDQAARGLFQSMRGPQDPTTEEWEEYTQVKRPQKMKKPRHAKKRRSGLLEDENGRTFRAGSDNVDDKLVMEIYESNIRGVDDNDVEFEAASPLSPKNYDLFAKAGLLTYSQVEEVAKRIGHFNRNNPELAFEDDIIEQYLFGVGSHHAGQLPAHKSFVESLFQRQLMKVVFATETLAAGINMPARTTVIAALAKRGDGSTMDVLETSNLLQMAGRAGRRGMDTSGTCVILATPFENEDDASKILTDDIKPITSQFSPSYSLAINLVGRGEGKLDVAKTLVQKSFAMWQKEYFESNEAPSFNLNDRNTPDGMAASSFINVLAEVLQSQVKKGDSRYDMGRITSLLAILRDRETLKKVSKAYTGLESIISVERATLEYLRFGLEDMKSVSVDTTEDAFLVEMIQEDLKSLMEQIETQQGRVSAFEDELKSHPFTALAAIANEIMNESIPGAATLESSLRSARELAPDELSTSSLELSASELAGLAKLTVISRRKLNKTQEVTEATKTDDAWSDLLAITKTLVAYGCLSTDTFVPENDRDFENSNFTLTQAGMNIGMLGFENSLWSLIAMGGAWDVVGASSNLDDSRGQYQPDYDSPGETYHHDHDSSQPTIPASQLEAMELTDRLRRMSSSEIAGYVSCLVSDFDIKRDTTDTTVDRFRRLSQKQKRAIQSSLAVLERFMQAQNVFGVGDKSRRCTFDISTCEVVTEWAAGCSWEEALALADAPPGDLVRTLSRAMDALRQLGNLAYTPLRKGDLDEATDASALLLPRGLHPEIRRLCREATRAINRYPVKDMLLFDTPDGDEGDFNDADEVQMEPEDSQADDQDSDIISYTET